MSARLRRGHRTVAGWVAHWTAGTDVTDGRPREVALRVGILAGGGVVCWHWPALAAVPAAWWAAAAWYAGRDRDAAGEPGEEGPAAPPPPTFEEFYREGHLRLIVAAMEDRPAVHLRDLLAIMRHAPRWESWSLADLRALLDDLGVPVTRSVRVGSAVTAGVRREHVEPLLRGWVVPGVDYRSPGALACVDAGVAAPVGGPVDEAAGGGGAAAGERLADPALEPAWP